MSILTVRALAISYVKPYIPLKQKDGSLVIGTKVAHTNLNAEMIISWMETYKYLGVDKVVTYRLKNLNAAASKVLDYYATIGILDVYDHTLADDVNFPRSIGYNEQTWSDLQVSMLEYFQRYSGYTFSGLIDHDEFLIPGANRTLKQMLSYLFGIHKDAFSFKFKSEFFVPSGTKQDTHYVMKQYTTRSAEGPKFDRPKLISRLEAKLPVPISSHMINSRKGTRTYDCPVDVGYVRHFREVCSCRTRFG